MSMKTVKKGEEIRRVKYEDADKLVKDGWSYTLKTEWKKKVRDANKKVSSKAEVKEEQVEEAVPNKYKHGRKGGKKG